MIQTTAPGSIPRLRVAAVFAGVVLLSGLAYGPMLAHPFISDDYVQIGLAREYGPFSGWPALLRDPLYRCRATSLLLTYWIERAVGLDPVYYSLASLLLHVVNGMLVFALGFWRRIGWPMAALAAGFFAISQRHSEAVVWFAALPELLVFFFVMTALLCWLNWLGSARWTWYLGAVTLFLAALFSKESAVAFLPLAGLAVAFDEPRSSRRWWGLAPLAAMGAGYFALIYLTRGSHLHFQDGTFALNGPFLQVLLTSAVNLLWVWGVPALALLVWLRRGWIASFGVSWIAAALIPYSFLTYMLRVPSRHTYLASAGLALLVGGALLEIGRRWSARAAWLVPVLAAIMAIEEGGYLWLVKREHYALRAQPTEVLIDAAARAQAPVYATCFPYSPWVAEYALRVRAMDTTRTRLIVGPEAAGRPDALDLCNDAADGVHYAQEDALNLPPR